VLPRGTCSAYFCLLLPREQVIVSYDPSPSVPYLDTCTVPDTRARVPRQSVFLIRHLDPKVEECES
jgi:hypothetical protein